MDRDAAERDGAPFFHCHALWTEADGRAGGGHIRFNMAKGSMSSHISQFPVGTYKKAHCHGPSAHVIIRTGDHPIFRREGDDIYLTVPVRATEPDAKALRMSSRPRGWSGFGAPGSGTAGAACSPSTNVL